MSGRRPFQLEDALACLCEAGAMAAGMEDANQATIEIRDGQAVLGGAVVS